MSKKISTQALAERIVEQHGLLEPLEISEYGEDNMPTGKSRREWTVSIPETLLGVNVAGYGRLQKDAKADLVERLVPILDSDTLTLADDWAERHLS